MPKAEGGLSYPPLSWGAQSIWSYFLQILEFVILQQQYSRTWGVSTNFVICDRHGPLDDSESTRGEVLNFILIIEH